MIDYAQALNAAQYEAATSQAGNTLVVAGAGTGKTRTIVYRLAWLMEQGVAPESILLLTFTRKAAQEMLSRAGALVGQGLGSLTGGTFHAFAYGCLRSHRPRWLENRSFTLMDAADITQAVKGCKDKLKAGKGDHSFPKTQTIAGLLSKSRNKEMAVTDILRQESFHLLPHAQVIEEIGREYAAFKRERALMDYDDLLFELEALLREDERAAYDLRRRYVHILVDEYQDTNLVQARIAHLLSQPAQGGMPGASVMAVGDEAQSIYAFRGANVRNILDFPKLFAPARVIRLEQNYRSTQPILDVANGILANAAESFRKNLFTERQGGELPRLVKPLSDISEADLIAARIGELLESSQPHEIAVLFRAGFHSYALENALRKAGIAFRKYGGIKFVEAAHVKDVLAFARLAINPLDLPAFGRIAAMHKGVGPKTVANLHAALAANDEVKLKKAFGRFPELWKDLEFIEKLRRKKHQPLDFFDAVLEYYRPRLEVLYADDWPSRLQGLEEIIQLAQPYESLDLFVADVALEAPEQETDRDGEQYVTLSTVHSAKGLEWKNVIIMDAVEERFPSRHAQARPEDFEEERRLFYVACTRAKQNLELYAPGAIYSRNGANMVGESPFVQELPQDLFATFSESCHTPRSFRGASSFGARIGQIAPQKPARVAAQGGGAQSGAASVKPRSCGASRPHAGADKAAGEVADKNVRLGQRAKPAAGNAEPQEARPLPKSGVDGHGAKPLSTGGDAALSKSDANVDFCRHRIFGRGKIVQWLDNSRVQVNFPGFGIKTILAEYLTPEE